MRSRATQPLVIVSGFPRTGTSAMMRMLYLGGMEILADKGHTQGKNEFAPHGDFELMGQSLHTIKNSLASDTAGKAVKVVSPFIRKHCPTDRSVRVVFMLRDINEIVASLLAMKVVWEWDPGESVADAREFLDENSIPVKYVRYADMFAYPRATAVDVTDWLGLELDIDKMVTAVDQNHRKDVKSGLVMYHHFTKALVDDAIVVDLKGESK